MRERLIDSLLRPLGVRITSGMPTRQMRGSRVPEGVIPFRDPGFWFGCQMWKIRKFATTTVEGSTDRYALSCSCDCQAIEAPWFASP
jgi:hypothetical protein